jgi:hypothetical protein
MQARVCFGELTPVCVFVALHADCGPLVCPPVEPPLAPLDPLLGGAVLVACAVGTDEACAVPSAGLGADVLSGMVAVRDAEAVGLALGGGVRLATSPAATGSVLVLVLDAEPDDPEPLSASQIPPMISTAAAAAIVATRRPGRERLSPRSGSSFGSDGVGPASQPLLSRLSFSGPSTCD